MPSVNNPEITTSSAGNPAGDPFYADQPCEVHTCDPFSSEALWPTSFNPQKPALDTGDPAAIHINPLFAANSLTCESGNELEPWQESVLFAMGSMESGDLGGIKQARDELLEARAEIGDSDEESLAIVDALLSRIAVLELSVMGGTVTNLERSIAERKDTAHGVLDSDGKMGFTQFESEFKVVEPISAIYDAAANLVLEGKALSVGEAIDAILSMEESDLDPSDPGNFPSKYGIAWSDASEIHSHVRKFRKLEGDPDTRWVANILKADYLDGDDCLSLAKDFSDHGLYSLASYNYDLYFAEDYAQAQGETSFEQYMSSLSQNEVKKLLHKAGTYESAEGLFGAEGTLHAVTACSFDSANNTIACKEDVEINYAKLFMDYQEGLKVNPPASEEDRESFERLHAAFAHAYQRHIQAKITESRIKGSSVGDRAWREYNDEILLTDKGWHEFWRMSAPEAERFWRMLPVELATIAAGGGLGGAAGKGVAKKVLIRQLAKKGLSEVAEEAVERGGMRALFKLAEKELGKRAVVNARMLAFGVESEVFSVSVNLMTGLQTGDFSAVTDIRKHMRSFVDSAKMLALYKFSGTLYSKSLGLRTQGLPTAARVPVDIVGTTALATPIITGGEVAIAGMQGEWVTQSEFAELLRSHIVISLGLGLVHAGPGISKGEFVQDVKPLPASYEFNIDYAFGVSRQGSESIAPEGACMHSGGDPVDALARYFKWADGAPGKGVEKIPPQMIELDLGPHGLKYIDSKYFPQKVSRTLWQGSKASKVKLAMDNMLAESEALHEKNVEDTLDAAEADGISNGDFEVLVESLDKVGTERRNRHESMDKMFESLEILYAHSPKEVRDLINKGMETILREIEQFNMNAQGVNPEKIAKYAAQQYEKVSKFVDDVICEAEGQYVTDADGGIVSFLGEEAPKADSKKKSYGIDVPDGIKIDPRAIKEADQFSMTEKHLPKAFGHLLERLNSNGKTGVVIRPALEGHPKIGEVKFKEHSGPRVYFTNKVGDGKIHILVCGNKNSQKQDIKKAQKRYEELKRRYENGEPLYDNEADLVYMHAGSDPTDIIAKYLKWADGAEARATTEEGERIEDLLGAIDNELKLIEEAIEFRTTSNNRGRILQVIMGRTPEEMYERIGEKWGAIQGWMGEARELGAPVSELEARMARLETEYGLILANDGAISVEVPPVYERLTASNDSSELAGIVQHFEENFMLGKPSEGRKDYYRACTKGELFKGKGSKHSYVKVDMPDSLEGVRVFGRDKDSFVEYATDDNVETKLKYDKYLGMKLPAEKVVLPGGKADGRFYISIEADAYGDHIGEVVLELQRAMKEADGKFVFKAMQYAPNGGSEHRLDQIVVYFNHAHQGEVTDAILGAIENISRMGDDILSDSRPYFTSRVRKGMAFGEEPNQESLNVSGLSEEYKRGLDDKYSFNSLRAEVLSKADLEIQRVREIMGEEPSIEMKVAILAHLLSSYGIDPADPAFNVGGTEKFAYIYENIAPDQGSHIGG